MKFLILPAVAFIATCTLRAEITRQQKDLVSALQEYQEDKVAFEEIAQRAAAADIPQAFIKMTRIVFHLHQSQFAEIKALLPEVEKARAELLTQEFSPIKSEVFDRLIQSTRILVAEWEKDPVATLKKLEPAKKRAQARSIREDLHEIDTATDMAAIDRNKANGAEITPQVWRSYTTSESRLRRTGTDCFGNPYGTTIVSKLPVVNRVSYERIKDVVPPEYFKPYTIGM